MSIVTLLIDMGGLVNDVASEQSEWSQRVFGTDAARGPLGPLKHLEKEAVEAQSRWLLSSGHKDATLKENGVWVGPPDEHAKLKEELADCLLLVLDAARRSGVKPMELFKAAYDKVQVNKARQWPTPQPDMPVEHIKGRS